MRHDSASTIARTRPSPEAERLEHRQLVRALADRLRHRVGRDQQDHQDRGRGDELHDQADVADLLGEPLDERLLGVGLRLGRRVGEHRVDLLRDLAGLLRVGDLDHVPADLVREAAVAHRLVQVVPVEEELRLVGALHRRIVDAADVELPRRVVRPAEDRRLERDAVADLPAESPRRVGADDRAGRDRPARPSSGPPAARTPGTCRSQFSGSTAMLANWFLVSW